MSDNTAQLQLSKKKRSRKLARLSPVRLLLLYFREDRIVPGNPGVEIRRFWKV